jgi:DNA polymerase III subunit gamma/tau
MAQALYRKWRPQKWQDVIGQDHIIQTLRNAVTAGRVAHAYLFAGPRGTGKTTTARLLAKAVNCLHDELGVRPCDTCDHCLAVNQGRFLDLIEIDAASNTSVEDVRDLREKINFSPNQGRYKVYIIDEVHMLSTAAFNALLKTLEEPPPHAIFVLATTEIHKIPATVLSRCQRHEFRRIPLKEMVEYLEKMAGEEGLQVDRDAVMLVARQSTGCLRDAISLLDQLSSGGEAITLEMALHLLGVTTNQLVVEIVESLVKEDVTQGLEHIHRALDGGSDPRQFARQLVEYLRMCCW